MLESELQHKKIENFLTPTVDEQIVLALNGKCPHNKGWKFYYRIHNDDVYKCNICKMIKLY